MENPTFKTKLLFWVTLGVFSTFFAEVISGSTPFPFLPIMGVWGMVMVTPLYTTHILVFAYLAYRYGKPRLHTLFLAGALFGMYEAYATGVLWAGWGDPPPILLSEVGVIETLVLVLFWHPVFAFIIPVILGEVALTRDARSSKDFVRLPAITPPAYRWRSFFLVFAVFVCTSVILSTFIGALQPFASITVLLSYAVMGVGLFAITLRQIFRRS